MKYDLDDCRWFGQNSEDNPCWGKVEIVDEDCQGEAVLACRGHRQTFDYMALPRGLDFALNYIRKGTCADCIFWDKKPYDNWPLRSCCHPFANGSDLGSMGVHMGEPMNEGSVATGPEFSCLYFKSCSTSE